MAVSQTSRRSSLTAALAIGAYAATPSWAAVALDPMSSRDKLEIFIRLRSRTDGKPCFMAYKGAIYGKPENQKAVALFGVEGFSISRATRVDADRYRLDNQEAGYFCDLKTGAPLEKWLNPLNGLETTVKHYRSWQHQFASADSMMSLDRPAGGDFTSNVPPPILLGDRIWMTEELIGRIDNKPRESFSDPLEYVGPKLIATSLATWSASRAEACDPRRDFVPVTLAYQTLGSWRPFMRMGTAPGLISWRMAGVKMPNLDGVPVHLRERVLRDYPDFLEKQGIR